MKQATMTKKGLIRLLNNTEFIIFLATLGLMFLTGAVNNAFFSKYNMTTLLRQMSFVTIVAFGQTLVLILGDIDLSVGAVACFTAITTGLIMTKTSINPYVVMALGLLIGAGCGLLNAVFITRFKITPFIITLGSQQIFTGLVYVLTEGRTVMGIPGSFTAIGQGMIFSIIPVPFLIMIVMGIIMFFVLKYTPFGRYLYAIGGNQSAATLVGISVNRCRTVVYVISGVLAALAGMLMMARLGSAQPTVGVNWVMPAITAAVLGGTSMSGGRGSVLGTVIGSLLMIVISNAIVIMRVSTYMEQVVTGSVVIIAVLIDSLKTRVVRK
jgi:ribose transport system permease protein